MDESRVATMLRDLADAPAPLSTMDISRAASIGRRRLRTRRLASGGSAVAGVIAVVAVVGLLATGTRAPWEPSVSMPAAAPAEFDPSVQYAEPGWLPDGAGATSMAGYPNRLELSADYPGVGTGDHQPGSGRIRLLVAPAGQTINRYFALPADPRAYAQMQVNGRPAWSADNRDATILRWEYAPQAWAGVEVPFSLAGADAHDVARRVAENVRYGVDAHVRLPFATTGVPAHFWVSEVEVSHGEQGSPARVSYVNNTRPEGGYGRVTIATVPGPISESPNTTVDGHPALLATDPVPGGGSSLLVFDVDGIAVLISTNDALTTAALPGGLVGLFRATEFHPDPDDWR